MIAFTLACVSHMLGGARILCFPSVLLHYIPGILFAVDFLLLKTTCTLKGKTIIS